MTHREILQALCDGGEVSPGAGLTNLVLDNYGQIDRGEDGVVQSLMSVLHHPHRCSMASKSLSWDQALVHMRRNGIAIREDTGEPHWVEGRTLWVRKSDGSATAKMGLHLDMLETKWRKA